jgi:hypothetical protein
MQHKRRRRTSDSWLPQQQQLAEQLEHIRQKLCDVALQNGLERREQQRLELVDDGGRRRRSHDSAKQRRKRLEEVVVEQRL